MSAVRDGGVKKPKHFRWAPESVKTFVPGIPTFVPSELSKQELKALLLRTRIEEIGYKIQNNQLDLGELTNDVAFMYDKSGRRVHAGESAMVNQLEDERSWLIEQAYRITETFKPAGNNASRQSSMKLTRKLEIPVDSYPDYNFTGLLIGPRGMTQKQLERDTNAKISIRGRGSGKDGNDDCPDQPLHVVVSGDDIASVKKAAAIVRKLCVPVEEGENDMKRAQLRKLAEIHGNVKQQVYEPMQRSWQSATVFCKHCGEISHTSMDCPNRNAKVVSQKKVDDEYNAFMKDLGLAPAEATPAPAAAAAGGKSTQTEADYAAFMNSFSAKGVDLKTTSARAAPVAPWAQPAPSNPPRPAPAAPQQQQFPPPPPTYGGAPQGGYPPQQPGQAPSPWNQPPPPQQPPHQPPPPPGY
eukprot:TRINITY_DN1482_c0_g2_i2.p1 TRINITY_DN1482_c0_g2~~TRINITY_DN1482_c0_g2_i2.p1  ORF type:complete len:429 (+),score=121.98 TRINITY_DN1482_c0_g2_i2:54-1289(+)